MSTSKPLTVISLGAGVQSSTMALMASAGEFDVMPDAAVFADTQAEPDNVYEWLDWLEPRLSFPIYRVTQGDLEADALERRVSGKSGKRYWRSLVPMWVKKDSGARGALTRKCTRDYKVHPIVRKLRELLGIRGKRTPPGVLAESWIGISVDEAHRMKPARETWVTNRWPLIDKGMSRADCQRWMRSKGYPQPPRSACVFCPYHGPDEWQRLKRDDPEGFARAVRFEREAQASVRDHDEVTEGVPFLWYGLKPLDMVDFRREPRQLSLFGNECEGMCGV